MITSIFTALAIAAFAQALPRPQDGGYISDSDMTNAGKNSSNSTYSLPVFDPNPAARAAEVEEDRQGYQYAPSLIGNSSFFLGGSKGSQLVQTDVRLWTNDAAPQRASVKSDAAQVVGTLQQ